MLIIIIGIALLAFITEEFFSATEAQRNQNSGVVGTINGKKIQSQEYSQLIESYKSYVALTQGKSTFTDDEDAALKEQVWQSYITNNLIEAEADNLGLTVTDDELRNVMAEGTNQLLSNTPFTNQQTGRFDANSLKSFLDEYKKMKNGTSQIPEQYREQYESLYSYWQFVERTLKQNLLQQKYNALLQLSFTSNPVEAKAAYEATTTSADLLLTGVSYSSVDDKEVSVTTAELKAKYEELKENFKLNADSKDIKYIAVAIKASAADRAELNQKMAVYAAEIATTDDIASLVRRSQSTVNYVDLPRTAAAYPDDISEQLDSMAPGSVKAPYYNVADNTMNTIKLISRTLAPDSIQMCQINVGGTDIDDARTRADSIYKALQAGADFQEMAQKYQQTGDSIWLTSEQYENATMDENTFKFINKVQNMQPGQMDNVELAQGNVIVKVTGRQNMVTKYNAAVIKCPLAYSTETSKTEYNKFSKFLAENSTIEDMEKNAAKSGYNLQTLNGVEAGDFFSMNYYSQPGMDRHMMRWISNDAKKWIMDEAKDGEVSTLYTCDNGNHLLVVAVVRSHKAGYLSLEDVKDYINAEVIRDKKAEKLLAELKDAKSLEDLQAMKGAQVDTVRKINFYSQSLDPAILGTVVGKKANDFVGPLKGYNAVFAYKVLQVNTSDALEFEAPQYIIGAAGNHARMALSPRSYYDESPVITALKAKAKIQDNRYKFY